MSLDLSGLSEDQKKALTEAVQAIAALKPQFEALAQVLAPLMQESEKGKKPDLMDSVAMDRAARVVVAETIRRDALAEQVGQVVGAFDAADMTEAEVAAYGLRAIGLSARPGQEATVLRAYLAGVKRNRDNFVTRHLKPRS